MKKLFTLVLALTMTVSLIGCGGKTGSSKKSSSAAAKSPSKTESAAKTESKTASAAKTN